MEFLFLKQINNTFEYINELNSLKNTILIGPHIEPNINLDRRNIIDLLKKRNFSEYSHLLNKDLIIVDKKLKEISTKKNIRYISKIELFNFDLERDFLINNKITFSDEDHWSDFGEIYFGKKLLKHPLLN